jgi:hypothetical protein
MGVIFSPTDEVINCCELADRGIEQFLGSINNDHFGKYEYEVECLINITHSVRIYESIIELARKDLVYVQSALILTRTLFEVLIRVSWMLHTDNVFESECRYVAQLDTECKFINKWIKEFEKSGHSSENYNQSLNSVSSFKNDLSALLISQGYEIPVLPNVREMLKSLNEERKYIYYMLLSQYTHLTHYSGRIYRRHLGTEKKLEEKVSLEDWKFIFSVCWPVFEFATEYYLLKSQNGKTIYSEDFKALITEALNAVY